MRSTNDIRPNDGLVAIPGTRIRSNHSKRFPDITKKPIYGFASLDAVTVIE